MPRKTLVADALNDIMSGPKPLDHYIMNLDASVVTLGDLLLDMSSFTVDVVKNFPLAHDWPFCRSHNVRFTRDRHLGFWLAGDVFALVHSPSALEAHGVSAWRALAELCGGVDGHDWYRSE